ncbi:ribbon-helix-helix protein, CopG family [Halomonas sp.]|uniref:ribbon-helix-helix protein, CopG family n=1 Tax=Halomonas sp. TaxID=1486246 RepID=UPI0025BDFD57|nr:ribbon-helix-helix protein, CopG family [Halomonas sp.]
MKRYRYSLCLDADTMEIVDEVASRNNVSRSAIVRMFLDLAKQVPAEKLMFRSPIQNLLGIDKEANHAD